MIEGVWESVRLGAGRGKVVYDLLKIKRVINGLWFALCMGDEVEDRLVVAHDEMDGRWEL